MIGSMTAPEKMKSYGYKAIAHAARVDLVTVYRWAKRLADGQGVNASCMERSPICG